MFFSYFARIVAYFALILGLLHILLGFGLASGFLGQAVDLSKYMTVYTSAELIDRGIYAVLFALFLGAISESSLTRR